MKFLILGCNGMAGHTISLYLKEQGHDVLGFDKFKSKYIESIEGDARNSNLLKELIGINKFDSIINCIGLLNEFAEKDKELATYLNAYLPHFLAKITNNSKTQIIHMSTDCVFSGNKGEYVETDFKDGDSFYDRSKALGELNDEKNITIRTSIIGPDINENGIGLFNWFMKQNGTINGYRKALWTGQTTLQLAKSMEKAAFVKAHGLYNLVPDTSISKYDLLQLFNKYFKRNLINILPFDEINKNKSLKRTNFDFECFVPDYESMIIDLKEWIYKHKNMYPHYKLLGD